jgi:FAD/FMN-containing dehydrogenase
MGSWGPACFSVKRIEVVTADGQIVTADEDANPDLFWAARGSGPGFFGVATRFQIQVYPLPEAIKTSTYVYPLDELEEIAGWAANVVPTLPPQVETLLALTPKAVVVTATAFADNEDHARQAVEPLESCPVIDRALDRQGAQPSSFDALQNTIETLLPDRHRYLADTLWSNHDLPALLPTLAGHIANAPSPKSLILAVRVPAPAPDSRMPDAAFSMVAKTILLLYAIWEHPDEDEPNRRWLHDTVASVEPLGVGHYIAEADLPAAPTRARRSFAPPNWARLNALRARHDPDGVFHAYLGLNPDSRTQASDSDGASEIPPTTIRGPR